LTIPISNTLVAEFVEFDVGAEGRGDFLSHRCYTTDRACFTSGEYSAAIDRTRITARPLRLASSFLGRIRSDEAKCFRLSIMLERSLEHCSGDNRAIHARIDAATATAGLDLLERWRMLPVAVVAFVTTCRVMNRRISS
jgi:hypothetical protein